MATTTTYKKADKNTGKKINKEGIKFEKKGSMLDKIQINGTGNSFVIVNYHKDNFMNHATASFLYIHRRAK